MEIKKLKKQRCEINKKYLYAVENSHFIKSGEKKLNQSMLFSFSINCCLCIVSKNQNNKKKISTTPVAFITEVLAFRFFFF